ncbi:MAG: hypothetical protein RSF70_05445 [Ruthenibacterium sp.]
MSLCKNCGAILPESHKDVCPICGAEQAPGSSNAAYVRPNKKSRDKTVMILCIIAAVLTLLLATASIACSVLYDKYNPDLILDSIGTSLMNGDTAKLQKMLLCEEVEATPENLQALCRAFTAQEAVDVLRAQLAIQAENPDAASERYPALRFVREKVFLGYYNYKMAVAPVALQIPASVQNPLLSVDGEARTGEAGEGGVLYTGFFPGIHKCVVSAQSGTGERVLGAETEVTLFNTDAPTVFGGALAIADITVAGCNAEDAIITVNDKEVAAKPVNGVLSLPQVAVGSKIHMVYKTAYGATTTGDVVFTDIAQPSLTFGNVVTEGGIPTEEQVNTLLSAYCASYLDCANTQDMSKLLVSTTLNHDRVSAIIGTADLKDNLFVFTSAAVHYVSVQQSEFEALPAVLCNTIFRYSATNRKSNEVTERQTLQTCELVFKGDQWLINRVVPCSEVDFAAGKLTPLQ